MKFKVLETWRGSITGNKPIQAGEYDSETFPYPNAISMLIGKGKAVIIQEDKEVQRVARSRPKNHN